MLDYEFFSDCFGSLLKVTSQQLYGFECTEVSGIFLNYLLHHLSFSFWPSGHSWELLLKRRPGNLSAFKDKPYHMVGMPGQTNPMGDGQRQMEQLSFVHAISSDIYRSLNCLKDDAFLVCFVSKIQNSHKVTMLGA